MFTLLVFFFFKDTATTEIYTLSLHDALPISLDDAHAHVGFGGADGDNPGAPGQRPLRGEYLQVRLRQLRSEEHTSELQSRRDLVCRLLLEKKKKKNTDTHSDNTSTPHMPTNL